MKVLENIPLQELKTLLGQLNIYADMRKKLGRRGTELFTRNIQGDTKLVVEYFPILGEDAAWKQAQLVFQKSFGITPEKQKVIFVPKEDIKGGMKIYMDDQLVDMSFTKVERLLQK